MRFTHGTKTCLFAAKAMSHSLLDSWSIVFYHMELTNALHTEGCQRNHVNAILMP